MKRLAPLILFALITLSLATMSAQAIQDPYLIQVTVTDADGVAVEGATVTITHIPSGASDETVTDSTGWAFIPLDSIATYSQGDDVRIDTHKGTNSATVTFDVDLTRGNEWGYEADMEITTTPLVGGDSQAIYVYLAVALGITGVLIGAFIWLKYSDK